MGLCCAERHRGASPKAIGSMQQHSGRDCTTLGLAYYARTGRRALTKQGNCHGRMVAATI